MSHSNIKNLTFDYVVKSLKIVNAPDEWCKFWDAPDEVYDACSRIINNPDSTISANKILELPDEAIEAFRHASGLIMNDRCLYRLLVACSNTLRVMGAGLFGAVPWPSLQASMGVHAGMFPAVVFLTRLDEDIGSIAARGIPAQIIKNTFTDLGIWMKDYHDKNGVWGLNELFWLTNHLSGKIYRLGRLQFIQDSFKGDIRVYRNASSGKTVTFSDGGICYRQDGLVNGTNNIYETEGTWISRFEDSGGSITGHPINAKARASAEKASIRPGEWEPMLRKGDPILDVHIAAGEKMDYEECQQSYRTAMDFFPKYFPDRVFKAFCCFSWLLDSQLADILDPSGNIVKFQSQYHLYSVRSDDTQCMERVFGHTPALREAVPADNETVPVVTGTVPVTTRLQKAVCEYVMSGHHMRSGAGYILISEIKT